jgi:hypothetical protein
MPGDLVLEVNPTYQTVGIKKSAPRVGEGDAAVLLSLLKPIVL